MNKIVNYGLCTIMSLSTFGCRNYDSDYTFKEKYAGYEVWAKHDGMGYNITVVDTAGNFIRADNIIQNPDIPCYSNVHINSFGTLSKNLRHYMSLDSLTKINDRIRDKHGIK
jgi:hypothetical protein